MPSIQTFDELNALRKKDKSIKPWSIPISRYFNEISLTKSQKKERIALAEDIEDAVMFFFTLVLLQSRFSYLAAMDSADAKDQLRQKILDAVGNRTELNNEIIEDVNTFVDDVNDTTTEHLMILNALAEEAEEQRQKENRYISEDRARLLAEEEANTIFNCSDFYKARELGYKYKTWITMRDSRVRKTHARVDDKTIPINDYFMIGKSLMRYPRDPMGRPEEVIACRCSARYTKS